jgi:hypothetical protein
LVPSGTKGNILDIAAVLENCDEFLAIHAPNTNFAILSRSDNPFPIAAKGAMIQITTVAKHTNRLRFFFTRGLGICLPNLCRSVLANGNHEPAIGAERRMTHVSRMP